MLALGQAGGVRGHNACAGDGGCRLRARLVMLALAWEQEWEVRAGRSA